LIRVTRGVRTDESGQRKGKKRGSEKGEKGTRGKRKKGGKRKKNMHPGGAYFILGALCVKHK